MFNVYPLIHSLATHFFTVISIPILILIGFSKFNPLLLNSVYPYYLLLAYMHIYIHTYIHDPTYLKNAGYTEARTRLHKPVQDASSQTLSHLLCNIIQLG